MALWFLLAGLTAVPVAADWATGMTAYNQGRYSEAEAEFSIVLAANPDHAGCHYMLGMARSRLGKVDEAVANLSRAREIEPDSSSYALGLASALVNGDRFDDAYACLDQLQPGSVDPAQRITYDLLRASAATNTGRAEEAIKLLERHMAEVGESVPVLKALGHASRRNGQHELAYRSFVRALELDPDDLPSARAAVRAAREVSEDLYEAGSHAASAEWLDQALELQPHDPLTLYRSARCLRCLERDDEAMGRLEAALARGPDAELTQRVHRQMAALLERRMDLATAAVHHRMAGNSDRALFLDGLQQDIATAMTERDTCQQQIAQLDSMSTQLDALNEADGVKRLEAKIAQLRDRVKAIDDNLAEVRAALTSGPPCSGG
jgi:tetratricopeptide (TPR) repeat protein